MDRMMMTFGDLVVTWPRRLRANWPALVLPAVVAEMIGLFRSHHSASMAMAWLMALLSLTVVLIAVSPAVAARMAPFALFFYGWVGLLAAHLLLVWRTPMLFYGLVSLPHGTGRLWIVLAEAFACFVASAWLLAVTGGPAGRAVRQAAHQLLGTGGQARTVPALLLLPVIGLWEEAYASPLWFGSATGELVALTIVLAGITLVVLQPRLAAVIAVLGLTGLGLDLLICALSASPYFTDTAARGSFWGGPTGLEFPASEMFAGLHGPLLSINGPSGLVKAEGGLMILAGCLLAPRMGSWAADTELARRAAVLAQRVDRLARTRSDAASTAVAELRRIERDLHDGAQARLVALGMSLRAAEQLIGANPEAARALVAEARETSSRALDDLRGLVRGIYPPVLADRGLGDAVHALALDTPLTVRTDITLAGEPPMPVAAAVYFGIAEALTNAVRHAGADTVQITIGQAGPGHAGLLRATVTDDGEGGADPARGTGLAGVERRLATFDGIVAVSSPAGGPTIVVIEVPCTLTDEAGHVARAARQAIG
jgi:signal transduction histidine kinase